MWSNMHKRLSFVIFIFLIVSFNQACADTSAGTSIESQAFITFNGETVTTPLIYAFVSQIRGIDVSPTSGASSISGGGIEYFPHTVLNVGNGSEQIYLSSTASTAGWETSLFVDDNRDQVHQETETTTVPASVILAEDADYMFFLAVDAPDAAAVGTYGYGTVTASLEYFDGPAYFGGNGILYGGDDVVSVTDSCFIGTVGNTRIRRDDDNQKIYLTWGGGPADIYYRTTFGLTFESSPASIEATNVTSPWTSEAIASQDGNIRYYRIAQTGTTSFAAGIMGKFDVDVDVGMNELSLPLVPYDTAISSVVGMQVTGANNAFSADRIWKYNPAVQANYDIAWLVDNVGPPFDGQWYTGNFPTTLSIEADEGFIVQIRTGHPATYLTFVGTVSEVGRSISIGVGMNFVGTCYPVEVPLGDQAGTGDSNLWESGMTGASNAFTADSVWRYNPAVQANYDIAWLVDNVNPTYNGLWYTGNFPTTIKLVPGKAYWLQVREGHSPFTWQYPKPY
jgi:hypothetical protein